MHGLKILMIPLVFFLMSAGGWTVYAPSLLAQPPPPPMTPPHLIQSFEDLLGRQEGLLHSFEWLIGQFEKPPVELLRSYEDLLHRQTDLLHSYEDVARPFACMPERHPELELIASFERLLHGQAGLLGSFEALIHRTPSMELTQSFEHLLRDQADLIQSFEQMLHCLVEVHQLPPRELFRFAGSFEELLRTQAELLESFESLIKSGPASMLMPPFDISQMMPEEHGLPSLEELRDLVLRVKAMQLSGQMRQIVPEIARGTSRLMERIRQFKQQLQSLRAQGNFQEADERSAALDEFLRSLSQLQRELVAQSLVVQVKPQSNMPGTWQVIVENRGPFTVTMAAVLLLDGPRMVFSQSLGALEPNAHRALTVSLSGQTLSNVRGVASGFIDFVMALMQASMDH